MHICLTYAIQHLWRWYRRIWLHETTKDQLFILQCDSHDVSAGLIDCARYNICNEFIQSTDHTKGRGKVIHVIFIIQLQRVAGGCFVGFQVSGDILHAVLTSLLMSLKTLFLCLCSLPYDRSLGANCCISADPFVVHLVLCWCLLFYGSMFVCFKL